MEENIKGFGECVCGVWRVRVSVRGGDLSHYPGMHEQRWKIPWQSRREGIFGGEKSICSTQSVSVEGHCHLTGL